MNRRTITKAELQYLLRFVEKKRVRHFDLQVELVDHLATSIEEQWQQYPERSLEEALQAEYKNFGIFGFGKLTDQKRRELSRRYRRLLHQRLLRWLYLPKLVVVLPTILLLSLLFQYAPHDLWLFVGILLGANIVVAKGMIQYYRFSKSLARKLLSVEVLLGAGSISFNLFGLLLQAINFSNFTNFSDYSLLLAPLLALLSVYALLVSYELVVHLFPKTQMEASALLAIYEITEIAE